MFITSHKERLERTRKFTFVYRSSASTQLHSLLSLSLSYLQTHQASSRMWWRKTLKIESWDFSTRNPGKLSTSERWQGKKISTTSARNLFKRWARERASQHKSVIRKIKFPLSLVWLPHEHDPWTPWRFFMESFYIFCCFIVQSLTVTSNNN